MMSDTVSTEFCLVFLPSQGQFSYNQVSSYIAFITCTDDKETPATQGTVEVRVERNLPPHFDPPGTLFREYCSLSSDRVHLYPARSSVSTCSLSSDSVHPYPGIC